MVARGQSNDGYRLVHNLSATGRHPAPPGFVEFMPEMAPCGDIYSSPWAIRWYYSSDMGWDAVEVKVNVASEDIPAAIEQLGMKDKSSMRVWFYEDLTPGIQALPLLHAGVILRARVREDGTVESTLKLRPCRLSQLTADWSSGVTEGDLEYTVEEDRSSTTRAIAASCTVSHPVGPSPTEPPYPIDELLTDRQRDFLQTCGSVRINPRTLDPLGPIEATRWKKLSGSAVPDLKPRAERWLVRGTPYLEISVRTTPETAAASASRLAQLLAEHNLREDDSQESKTSRVLSALTPPAP